MSQLGEDLRCEAFAQEIDTDTIFYPLSQMGLHYEKDGGAVWLNMNQFIKTIPLFLRVCLIWSKVIWFNRFCCKMLSCPFSPPQLQLPQSISSQQLECLQPAELRTGQPINQRLQVGVLTAVFHQLYLQIQYTKRFTAKPLFLLTLDLGRKNIFSQKLLKSV